MKFRIHAHVVLMRTRSALDSPEVCTLCVLSCVGSGTSAQRTHHSGIPLNVQVSTPVLNQFWTWMVCCFGPNTEGHVDSDAFSLADNVQLGFHMNLPWTRSQNLDTT